MLVKPGYIYVLIHPSDKYLVKVGMTTRDPSVRLKEHNSQLDKAAGVIVKQTGVKWVLKQFFAVDDTASAESTFYNRSPLTEFPHGKSTEILRLDDKYLNWDWVNEGLELAKLAGIRRDITQSPIPKKKPRRGSKWIEEQVAGSGLTPLKGFGNGITKVAIRCERGHTFKISGYSLAKFPFCPICSPQKFDAYTLRRVDFIDG